MGMDIFGTHPINETGRYFRNNISWWCPLAGYIIEVAPEVASRCTHWHSNDGDGLTGDDCVALADKLQAEIDSGRTKRYETIYTAERELMPNEPCDCCEGTGIRKPAPEWGAGDLLTGIKCNGCDGSGYVRPYSARDYFSVENVRDFVAFLRGCGGFAIW